MSARRVVLSHVHDLKLDPSKPYSLEDINNAKANLLQQVEDVKNNEVDETPQSSQESTGDVEESVAPKKKTKK